MTVAALITLVLIVAVLATLALTRVAPDVILMAALAFLVISGILTPSEALAGFANPGVMTIATLYVVAAGLKETGAIQWLAHRLLGQPRRLRQAQLRVLLPASGLSAFMNNTTVVAMFIPAIQEWAARLRLPTSKLLLPLSYASILGGTCTLIGTSTNLVVDGLLQSERGIALHMFELAWVGVPLVVIGGSFLYLMADRLLPNRQGALEQLGQAREYAVEVRVIPQGSLEGKSIADAGLRSLAHGYLADIERDGELMTAVPPETKLQVDDILVFVGAPECARELRRVHGLRPANGDVRKLDIAHHRRCLVEAVIGPDFTGIEQTVRESRFRSRYQAVIQAVIISISRHGRRLPGKLGDIRLQVGDTLLMETAQEFVSQYQYHQYRKDFLLVSALNDSTPPDFRKAPWALGILGAMVLESTYGDRRHEDRRHRQARLKAAIDRALENGGTVIVPAFSIGRTQELLYELEGLIHRGAAGSWHDLEIIVDSPLAARFTEVYRELKPWWDAEAHHRLRGGRHPLSFENLYTVASHEEHERTVAYLATSHRPAVVIAASGMATGGRVVNYLTRMLPDERHAVVFIGYQGAGTPGRDIQHYGPRGGWVELDGQRVDIRARIETVSGYSAHADRRDLINFVKRMRHPPRHVRLVHGEPHAQQALKAEIERWAEQSGHEFDVTLASSLSS